MAVNFPDNPTNGDTTVVNGVTYTYNATNNLWKAGSSSSGGGGGGVTVYSTITELPMSNNTDGEQAYVDENNTLYMWLNGWYKVGLINTAPTITQGGAGYYMLATDGTPTVITLEATDPEGIPLTWSYSVTSGALGTTATVSQADNVFTITPGTNDPDDVGTFELTFSVTDGVNSSVDVNEFVLAFITAIPSGTVSYTGSVVTYTQGYYGGTSTIEMYGALGGEGHGSGDTFNGYTGGGFSQGTYVLSGTLSYTSSDEIKFCVGQQGTDATTGSGSTATAPAGGWGGINNYGNVIYGGRGGAGYLSGGGGGANSNGDGGGGGGCTSILINGVLYAVSGGAGGCGGYDQNAPTNTGAGGNGNEQGSSGSHGAGGGAGTLSGPGGGATGGSGNGFNGAITTAQGTGGAGGDSSGINSGAGGGGGAGYWGGGGGCAGQNNVAPSNGSGGGGGSNLVPSGWTTSLANGTYGSGFRGTVRDGAIIVTN